MKTPTVVKISDLVTQRDRQDQQEIQVVRDNMIYTLWVPARYIHCGSVLDRFRVAWKVFTGKCDALDWEN